MARSQPVLSTRTALPTIAWLGFGAMLSLPLTPGAKGALALVPVLATAWATGRWGGAFAGVAAAVAVVVAHSIASGVPAMVVLARGAVAYAVTPSVGFMSGWVFERGRRARSIAVELQEQKHRLEEAQARAAIGDWSVDRQTLEVDASRQTLRIFGLPEGEQPRLDRFFAAVHPEDRDDLEAATLRALEEGVPFAADFRVVRPDGTVRWLEGRGEVEQVAGRNALCGTTQDVTRRKEAEQRLATMLENHPDGVARFTREGACLHRNPVWQELVAAGVEDGSPWARSLSAGIDQAVRTAAGTEFIAMQTGLHGRHALQTQVVPELDGAGRVATLLVVVRDVTEMQKATTRLRNTRDTLQVMLDAAPVPIMQVDEQGRVVLANRATEALFGYPSASLVGRRPPMVPAEAEPDYVAGMATGITVVHDTLRLAEDGNRIPVDAYTAPLPEGGFVRIDVDLRERKSLEEARRETEKLREMDAFKTEFLNTAAHELSTPLTPIKLQLAMMQDPGRPDNGIALLARNIGRLERLVRDLMDAAHLQSGRLRFESADVDLHAALADAVRSFEARVREEGLTLQADLEPSLSVLGDEQRVSQILFNLLSNACKFTPKGGRIHVRGRRDGDQVVVEVEDSGHGMTKRQLDGLFQPFSQFHRDQVGAQVGTGLGLYICRGIMEAHGGSIEARSGGVGRGTTFSLRFPARASAVPSPAPVRRRHAGLATAAGPAGTRR